MHSLYAYIVSLFLVFISLLGCKISLFPILGKSTSKPLFLSGIFNRQIAKTLSFSRISLYFPVYQGK